MTDTEISEGEIDRVVAGHHHDPHSVLGAHPGPDGVIVRALRPLATSVTLVLDFEGEPASPLAQRRARSSPLRDVAGMLRSFEYAARHQLIARPDAAALAPMASGWVRRNSDAFCAGYAAAGGLDPAENWVLLRAMLLDKAVYEVIYEARNRPTWVSIPLESIAEL